MEQHRPRLIVIGHSALDHVFRIDEFPERPRKIRALEHLESGGGSAANSAVAIARLGGDVEFWSRVGDDAAGKRIISNLRSEGVETRYVLVHRGSRSSESAVVVDRSGERLIVSERDHAMPVNTDWLPLERIRDAAIIVSDLRWYEATATAFHAARKHGVKTLLDIDIGGGDEIAKYLPTTNYAIFSAPALSQFCPEGSDQERLSRVLALGVCHAGVTKGSEGYVWESSDGTRGQQSAFKVTVVDSTGAGDAFHGAFAWAISQGLCVEASALLASAAAAIKCRKLGARQGLPNRSEIMDFLRSEEPARAAALNVFTAI